MQQNSCSETANVFRRGSARASTAHALATSFVRRRPHSRHNEAPSTTQLKRSEFVVIMRPHMRASITIRTDKTRRVESNRRATRVAAIALASIVLHLASTPSPFVAKAHAQGLAPAVPSTPSTENLVRAELVSDVAAMAPGRPFRLAVRLEIKDGWHVNWLNPGDAGLAPGVEWRLPKSFKTAVLCWPYPSRFPTGPMVIYGYAKELFLVTDVTPPADLPIDTPVELGAEVTWLACEEACIPGSASLSFRIPVESRARASDVSPRIDAWRARCPGPAGAWGVDASLGDQATLLIDLQTAEEGGATLNSAYFYPYEPGVIEHAAAQPLSVLEGPRGRSAYQLRLELWRMSTTIPDRIRGILVMESTGTRAIEVDVPLRKR